MEALTKSRLLQFVEQAFHLARRAVARYSSKFSKRRYTLHQHIVQRCVEKGVGRINVEDLEGVREDKNGDSKNWERHGNLDLHGWAFDRFTSILEYKSLS